MLELVFPAGNDDLVEGPACDVTLGCDLWVEAGEGTSVCVVEVVCSAIAHGGSTTKPLTDVVLG
jgi:hypothetical protein